MEQAVTVINIRDGCRSDLAEITRLERDLTHFDRAFDPTLDPDWPASPAGREFYEARLSRTEGLALVAEEDGRVVGYLLGCLGKAAEYSTAELTAEVECLYVDPTRRGEGIGGRLVARFEEWARAAGARRLRVTVSAANRRALRFYRHRGFRLFDVLLDKPLVNAGGPAAGD